MTAGLNASWDAAADALAISAPVRRWARFGFLRGFAGASCAMPVRHLRLPSSLFLDEAVARLGRPADLNGPELDRRLAYVERVAEALRAEEDEAVGRHYRLASRGMATSLLAFLGLLAGVATLGVGLGHEAAAATAFLTAVAARHLCRDLVARKARTVSAAAFPGAASAFSLPWERTVSAA